MSDKPKHARADAIAVARELVKLLEGTVERMVVAGSLRRGKQFVGDVELLYIPKLVEKKKDQAGLFGDFEQNEVENLADKKVTELLEAGALVKRPSVVGVFTWGKENKLAIHAKSGIPVDLFATDAKRWFVALVIRTGGKDTNLKLTTGAQKMGRTLHAYGSGVTNSDGTKEDARSEEDVFRLCGVPFLEPTQRT